MLTAFDFFANISKDYRDMRGDMISNVRTIPIVIGRSRAIMLEFSALYVVFTLPLMYFITSIDNDYILLLLTPIGLLITYSAHRSVSMYRDVECYKYMIALIYTNEGCNHSYVYDQIEYPVIQTSREALYYSTYC
jgi:4-hydroxybenzoate polyprenyltransferase